MADKDYNEVDNRRLAYRLLSDVFSSTTTPLTAGSTYDGVAFDVDGYDKVVLTFYADQDALVRVQYRNDGTNWDAEEELDYTAGDKQGIEVIVVGDEARIEIENDSGTDMTTMRMHARAKV